jgi:hypothetical protein
MALYLISYDLLNKKTFGDYETLISELRKLGAKEALFSQWLLRSNASSSQIREFLKKFIHSDDRILVTEISTNWAGRNLMVDPNKF